MWDTALKRDVRQSRLCPSPRAQSIKPEFVDEKPHRQMQREKSNGTTIEGKTRRKIKVEHRNSTEEAREGPKARTNDTTKRKTEFGNQAFLNSLKTG